MVTPKKPTATSTTGPASGGKSPIAQTPSARPSRSKPSTPVLTAKAGAQATAHKPNPQTGAVRGTTTAGTTANAPVAGTQARRSQTSTRQRLAPVVSDAPAPVTVPPRSLLGDGGVSAAERTRLIERAAYFRAQRRGFVPGHEVEDWVAAEQEIDQLLSATSSAKYRGS